MSPSAIRKLTAPVQARQDAISRARKRVQLGLYLSPNMPLSYNGFSEFVFTAVRGVGKTVIGIEAGLILKRKYGYENVKMFYFRTNDNSIKALLQPDKAVDPYLVHKYDMHVTKKGNKVFNDGKLLYEAYPLVSAASIGKGVNLYDTDFFDPEKMGGKKHFIVTIWDEFMLDDGVGRKSIGDPVKQYMIYREAIFRDAQRLPYNAVYNFLLANNVSECANVTGQLFNFIPNPNDRRVIKLTRKHAIFWNVPVTRQYIEKRKNSYNAPLIADDDPNYHDIERDLTMIKKKSTRIYRLTNIIKFSKYKSDWFCVYDNKYVKKYRNEKFKKDKVIAMYRNQEDLFNIDLARRVLDMSDYRAYMFCDIMSMAAFQAAMKTYKAK